MGDKMKTKINKYLSRIIKMFALVLGLGIWSNCSDEIVDPPYTGNNGLGYVTPEDVGYSSSKLEEAKQFAEKTAFDAVMALYDGKVIFSWGEISENYQLHSIRKPLLSSLYGIHVDKGNINLDATLDELNIDDIPPSLSENEKQATVRELLQARSGVYHEAAAEAQAMKDLRPARGSHEHGTYYYYNNWDFNTAGTIFEQETGTKIFEEFERRIAEPIGMEDFSHDNCFYDYEHNLSMHPAYKFRISCRDLARFGTLYLNNGNWNGRQIIPGNWINESTKTYSIEDSTLGIGYGYMWRVYEKDSFVSQMLGGHRIYGHTGLGGVQALIIIPELKLVIAQRTNTDRLFIDDGKGMELGLMIINSRIK